MQLELQDIVKPPSKGTGNKNGFFVRTGCALKHRDIDPSQRLFFNS